MVLGARLPSVALTALGVVPDPAAVSGVVCVRLVAEVP